MEWIIIVDDDKATLNSAGNILSEIGIQVTALTSGQALLDYFRQNPLQTPDLILLAVNMPEMSGFETLKRLRRQREGKRDLPVIFLTADNNQDSEITGLQLGALDFLRKPFVPDVLAGRVQNALRTQEKLHQYEREAMIDTMTGFLNKSAAEDRINEMCRTETGFLCVLDLDSFKLINDLYGHHMGDRVLTLFADLVKNQMRAEDVCGRIGGDEFLIFAKNMRTEKELIQFSRRINDDYMAMLRDLLGDPLKFSTGISIGAAAVPAHGRDFDKLFRLADQALSGVKQSGKHNCALNGTTQQTFRDARGALTLDSITMILEERNISANAMWMGREAFANIYRYMIRYMKRYHGAAYRALVTLHITDEKAGAVERADVMEHFRRLMQESLRNSDVMVEISENQIFLLLPETHEAGIDVVVDRLMTRWNHCEYHEKATVTWETGQVSLTGQEASPHTEKRESWVAVADGDGASLALAESILTDQGIRVTALSSGRELIDFLRLNHPDLILLDAKLPDMDGFEALRLLKYGPWKTQSIPVVYTCAEEEKEAELLGVKRGADDFIIKPYAPGTLSLRVCRNIEFSRMQRNLSYEVALRVEESQKFFLHLAGAMAKAIDAKDAYTSGHSDRVASYAREIARRFGYDKKRLDDLYMMALLHDIGKIAVPDDVMKKPGKLTEEEYGVIKTHAVIGADMLQSVSEMPLSTGARWHHERFGGGGYPDGLSGESIPEEARIIAVADAYDAMSSRRRYRGVLSQEHIREEIERGAGSQFDPRFARIMLEMMDEDPDYRMKE